MRRVLFGLMVIAVVASAGTRAEAHGRHRHGWRGGFYARYAPPVNPYRRGYHRPRAVYYPAVGVYPVYPVYAPPRTGFSYFSPGFSFSIAR